MSETERDFLDDFADSDAASPEVETTTESDIEPEEAGTVEKEPGTAAEATTAEATTEKEHVPLAALKAEREKRQEREKRIAELEAALEKTRPQAQKAPPEADQAPELTFWEDPDAFIASRVSKSERELQHRFLVAREDDMREKHKDYDEVIEKVKEYGQSNPAGLQQILSAPDPAKAGYQFGKKLIELKQMEDPDAYRARIEAEVRAKIAQEAEEEASGKARSANAIPPDLSSARNVGASGAAKEPDPFKELFPRK